MMYKTISENVFSQFFLYKCTIICITDKYKMILCVTKASDLVGYKNIYIRLMNTK